MAQTEVKIILRVDGKEVAQTLKLTEEQVAKLKAKMEAGTGSLASFGKSMKEAGKSGGDLTNVMGQLGWVVGDAGMFMTNFRMGMMSIGNNIPMVVQGLIQAKDATGGWKGVMSGLGASLMGPGGVMLGVNALMFALQVLPELFGSTTKAAEDNAAAIKELSNELEQMSVQSLRQRLYVEQLGASLLQQRKAAEEAVIGYDEYGAAVGGKLTETTKNAIAANAEAQRLIMQRLQEIGIEEGINNEIAELQKKKERTRVESERVALGKRIEELQKTKRVNIDHHKDRGSAVEAEELVHREYLLSLEKDYHKRDLMELDWWLADRLAKVKGNATAEAQLREIYGQKKHELEVKIEDTEARGTENPIEDPDLRKSMNEFQIDRGTKELMIENEKYLAENKEAIRNAEINAERTRAATILSIDEELARGRMEAMAMITSGGMNLFGKHTLAYKILATVQATLDTYKAANLALASYPPPFSFLAAGLTIAAGLANVAKINAIEVPGYAKGGFALTGENGPEIIAPVTDYAHGQAALIEAVVSRMGNAGAGNGSSGEIEAKLDRVVRAIEGLDIRVDEVGLALAVNRGNARLGRLRR
jgi:hypothetical protein